MSVATLESDRVADRAVWHDRWVIEVGEAPASAADRSWSARSRRALSISALAGSDMRVAEDDRRVVLFAGVLTNARELRPAGNVSAATIVLDAFASQGSRAIDACRGPFVIVVFDKHDGSVIVARDHVGLSALCYARRGTEWLFAPSADTLVNVAGVSREADAVALSEWLCGWYPAAEDTAYRHVKRIVPATVLRVAPDGTARTERYWDPAPEDRPVEWLTDDELAEFEPSLRRATTRAIASQSGRAGIFLSGGLDSIAVALNATDVARASDASDPIALSLRFPDGESNEGDIQAGVSRQLGIPQELVPFEQAVGPRGLVREAMALSSEWPQPMWNMWAPAYMELARRGVRAGIGTILTGRGGDEWLTVTPYLLADLVRRGDVRNAWRLLQVKRAANQIRSTRDMMRLVWLTACRPLLGAALDFVAQEPWHRRRRRRLLAERPAWLAPDPRIREAMDGRIERWISPARPSQGFYFREARLALTHPAVMHDLEETQEFGRRNGVRVMHPFWDVDLLTLLFRARPETLSADGQSKWLLRKAVAPRLPNLGLERRGKVRADYVFRGIMDREADGALRELRGLQTLQQLGVVEQAGVISEDHSASRFGQSIGPGKKWGLLNIEAWVRPRS